MNGINKVAHNLALHQADLGHEVSIWGITPTPEAPTDLRPYHLRLFRASTNKFRLDKELATALTQLNSEVAKVHLHGSYISEFFHIARLLQKKRIPYVYCPHGGLSPGAFRKGGWRKRIYIHLIERHILKHAQAIQFLGQTQYDNVDQLLAGIRKQLIPNGQNIEELTHSPQKIQRPSSIVFSYCGRLIIGHKALDLLLEGFAQYQQQGGQGHLWLIGDGPDRRELEDQKKALGLEEQVVFWGAKYGEEKLNLLSHSDAFVHPSRSEGLPTGVLEAAGLGLPCLLTKRTNLGVPFKDYGAGILIDPNTAEQIAIALWDADHQKACDQLPEMGEKARELIQLEYNWSRIAQRTVEMYTGVSER